MEVYRFDGKKLNLTDKEWEKRLTPEQYKILREKGTDFPFDNKYYNAENEGLYVCAGCELPLFESNAKYDSGSGWPSFWKALCKENVTFKKDSHLSVERIEVLCNRCGGHLGHIFNDGPLPTGKRYCINSTSLKFLPTKKSSPY